MTAAPARRSWRLVFWAAIAALLVIEFLVVSRAGSAPFITRGRENVVVRSTNDNPLTVAHSFLMRGAGLNGVVIELDALVVTDAVIDWTLWRGHRDKPGTLTRAFQSRDVVRLHRGRQSIRLPFTRDASSHDRWYTLEIRLPGEPGAPDERNVGVVVSRDNPMRGGVLWVDAVRQPGSLRLRAERQARPLLRQFEAEVAPNLPAPLRNPWAQAGLAVLFHWALIMIALALVSEAMEASEPRRVL